MDASKSTLLSVVGPTAVGKTKKAIEFARILQTEILSVDSRQVFQEMNVGTAKPTANDLRKVRHHFIDTHSIREDFSAGHFEREALVLLKDLFIRFPVVVAVGGSGLYFKALWQGFDDMPEVQPGLREVLNERFRDEGIEPLLQELKESDPDYFNTVDRNNHQRVIRALEVIRTTGKRFSSFRTKKNTVSRDFKVVKVGLEMAREELYRRIDIRMDEMIEEGLFDEAKELYPFRSKNALQTVGYSEIFGYLDGNYDRDEAIRLLKRNSRRYAKRQLTWFKSDPEIKWFDASEDARKILISLQLL